MLFKTIPGICDFISLILIAEIYGVERFSELKQLKSYANLVPSVRNSAYTVHHWHVTKRGKPDDAMGAGGICYHSCLICRRVTFLNFTDVLQKREDHPRPKLQQWQRCWTSYFVC